MAAVKLLQNQLKKLISEPVEGFTAELIKESNLFEWRIYLEGPKDTPYTGGIFQLIMQFPSDYPMSPPSLRFTSEFWHPNVYYPDGKVCISILHPPVADEMSGELPEERWLPTQTVSTVLLSVISMLGDPNYSSPANVDASVECRRNFDAYKKRIAKLVEKANRDVPSHVKIPHPDTDPEERKKQISKLKAEEEAVFELSDNDNFDDEFVDYDEEDVDEYSEEEPSTPKKPKKKDIKEKEQVKEVKKDENPPSPKKKDIKEKEQVKEVKKDENPPSPKKKENIKEKEKVKEVKKDENPPSPKKKEKEKLKVAEKIKEEKVVEKKGESKGSKRKTNTS